MGCSADEVQPQSGVSRPPPPQREHGFACGQARAGRPWPGAPHADTLQFCALGRAKKGLVCFMVVGFASLKVV